MMIQKTESRNGGSANQIQQPSQIKSYNDFDQQEVASSDKIQNGSNKSVVRQISNPPSLQPASRGGIGSQGNINQGLSSGDSKEGLKRGNSNSRNADRDQMRTSMSRHSDNQEMIQTMYNEGRIKEYTDDEENIICPRFPHLNYCGCQKNLVHNKEDGYPYQIIPGIFVGDLETGFCTKKLLQKGITHVLNVTSTEYQKRENYFKYLNIDVFDQSDEDIKQHFRISNRFINSAIQVDGKVLIHSMQTQSLSPAFALAYLINHQKIPLQNGIDIVKETVPNFQLSPEFYQQLERYDLEQLALVTLKQQQQ